MQLNNNQIEQYEKHGYLFFPGLLDTDEVAVLPKVMPDILVRRGPEVIREKHQPTAVRLAFGSHVYSEPFRRLSLLPRLIGPVRQLLSDGIYLHQSRINPKQGFGTGASWDWHQDYPPWHKIDGMPEPRCVVASVFIDDCSEVTSPLLIVPGSQRHGLLDSELHPDAKGQGYALHSLGHVTLKQLAEENGIEALMGPAGSVAFVHCNVVHGSANNVSPWRRAIMYLIYNAVSNACTGTDRAWYQNNRDVTSLLPLDDDCLKALS